MKGEEDGFGILGNASASQLVSFSRNKGLQPGVMGHSVTGEKEGLCRLTYMKRKIPSGLEGTDVQHLPMTMWLCVQLSYSSLETLTCFNLRVTQCTGSEGYWGWGSLVLHCRETCGTLAHLNTPKGQDLLLNKITGNLGWEVITGCQGTTLLKWNSWDLQLCCFACLPLYLVCHRRKAKSQARVIFSPARVQGAAGRHLVSPLGINIQVTTSFKCEGRVRPYVKDFWQNWMILLLRRSCWGRRCQCSSVWRRSSSRANQESIVTFDVWSHSEVLPA